METAIPVTTEDADLAGEARKTGVELKRGALFNTIAMLTSNFRAVFTILIARLLGPIALGIFSVVWATTDLFSKFGIIGLDDAVTTFVARANAAGDRARCRALFHVAAALAITLSAMVALLTILGIKTFGSYLHLAPEMAGAMAVVICALPGIALYRISTSVSRGMKIMHHDIYSRGLTESGATTLAFLAALAVGFGKFAPEVAAIAGTAASGVVAFTLASKLFRILPDQSSAVVSRKHEARQLVLYALPIGADQFLNAFIWRLDVIFLGLMVGHAPGVTLTTLGIYAGVVGIASGLRKVSQSFTPIFTPVVAGMTAMGERERAIATYARLIQWMLWILLPLVAVMTLAGNTILIVLGRQFQHGTIWLDIVALACATNAFINLGETVIMVQRPGLNFLNSFITCVVGSIATLLFISQLGALGAALGILTTYLVQGLVRNIILRVVFQWRNPWSNVSPPVMAAFYAAIPALLVRMVWHGIIGQMSAATAFLAIFGFRWWRHRFAPVGLTTQ
jgi:O-antigen/teichoic acid export membrane protein